MDLEAVSDFRGPRLSVGRENAIGNQGVGVRVEVFAIKMSLLLFQRFLDVDQVIFLCG
jgi:hypothetical protein